MKDLGSYKANTWNRQTEKSNSWRIVPISAWIFEGGWKI